MNLRATWQAMWVSVLVAGAAWAQSFSGLDPLPRGSRPPRIIRIEGGGVVDEDNVRTARETVSHAAATPVWTNAPGFEHDAFTFARLVFRSEPRQSSSRGFGPRLGWWVDYPDAVIPTKRTTSAWRDPDCSTGAPRRQRSRASAHDKMAELRPWNEAHGWHRRGDFPPETVEVIATPNGSPTPKPPASSPVVTATTTDDAVKVPNMGTFCLIFHPAPRICP